MSSGVFSSGVGGPVSMFLSSTNQRPASSAMQSRISKYAVAAPPPPLPVHAEPEPEPEAPTGFGNGDFMECDAVEADFAAPDPWAGEKKDKPKKKAPAPVRKSKPARSFDPLVDGDDEDESEDNDFVAADEEDDDDESGSGSDGSSDDDDDDGDESDASDDDTPDMAALTHDLPMPKPKAKHAAADAPPKAPRVRKTNKELLAEQQMRIYGRVLEDDDDEGESVGSSDDDDDEEDDDEEEDDSAESGIVRDDAARIDECLGFKRDVLDVSALPRKPRESSALDSVLDQMDRDHNRQIFEALLKSLGKRGLDVNAAVPTIDPENPMIEEDPVESSIQSLIPRVIGRLETDEPDLTEQLASLSRAILSRCVTLYRASRPQSPDIGTNLANIWNGSNRFYNRVMCLLGAINKGTRSRFCYSLMLTFTNAFVEKGPCEFVEEKIYENSSHERAQKAFRCASCGDAVTPCAPEPGPCLLGYYVAYSMMLCKTATTARGASNALSVPVVNYTRPAKGVLANTFLCCPRCKPLFVYMNQLLTAPYDLVRLAQLWIYANEQSVLDITISVSDLGDSFHGWEYRRRRCNAIAMAYQMMHLARLR